MKVRQNQVVFEHQIQVTNKAGQSINQDHSPASPVKGLFYYLVSEPIRRPFLTDSAQSLEV